jgi:hypothetical protein
MRDWSLRQGDPLSLTLAADTRLSKPNYLDDHIWELDLRGGEPRSLTIRTTYGLRARAMRVFFLFAEGPATAVDPVDFHEPPRVRRFYPNFVRIDFVPLDGLEVVAEYWVPSSHVLAGRLTCTNRLQARRRVEFEICAVLTPLDGKPLNHIKHQMVSVLAGRTSDLQTVVFMAGAPRHGTAPQPSLAVTLDLEPDTPRTLHWACAAEGTAQQAFDSARQACTRPWDAERARIENLDAREVLDIYTGDPEWDAALALSQKASAGVFYPASGHLPEPSFVRARQPDTGYSRLGNGSDHAPSWSGQTPLDTYYLAGQLPVLPATRLGLIRNFLEAQTRSGAIDAKPGLAGQRSRFLAAPLLATLAWGCHQDTEDAGFLKEAFPRLMAFYREWFRADRDSGASGIPAWENILQTSFEDNPLFDVWHPWSQSLDISTIFNPELESFLWREAASLVAMAQALGRDKEIEEIRRLAAPLESSIAAAWNPQTSLYSYRDRTAGASSIGTLLGQRVGPGDIVPEERVFEAPVRLLIQVQRSDPASGRPTARLAGRALVARAGSADAPGDGAYRTLGEALEERQFRRHTGGLIAATANAYVQLERIVVNGARPDDRIVVRTIDTSSQDITLFAPLWARAASSDQARAMVDRIRRPDEPFNRPYGVPALAASAAPADADSLEATEADALAMSVHLPWNQLLAEGLLAYGFRDEAASLFSRLMRATIGSLKQNHAFYERYHAETGAGLGERGALVGFAPVGLFLQILGVRLLSPTRVRLEGSNPFPWPVTLSSRGLRIVRGLDRTEVTFPNGQVSTVTDPAPCVVSV